MASLTREMERLCKFYDTHLQSFEAVNAGEAAVGAVESGVQPGPPAEGLIKPSGTINLKIEYRTALPGTGYFRPKPEENGGS
ncbi:MAG: hypothetical protein LBT14_01420 [Treponema sp.]|jgi:hypothetical protein|nr:hypothetical protein [Treponema sp.]